MKQKRDHFGWMLGSCVLLSRILSSGPVYFADGPAEIASIRNRTYLIQPPGYWLQHRIAGLFPNPEFALLFLNWIFSAVGVIVFYYLAKKLVSLPLARLGSVAYAAIFFVWFSGGVHSTYSSQLLFPVLTFYLLLLYRDTQRFGYLLGAAAAFAVGAGMRPSDGVFVAPVMIVAALCFAPWRRALLAFLFSGLIALFWLIPTWQGYVAHQGAAKVVSYTSNITSVVSVLHVGLTPESEANIARFFVPVLVAFWPLLAGFWLLRARWKNTIVFLLLLWVLPGSMFFVLFYMSYPLYLDCLVPAIVLLALFGLEGYRIAPAALLTCIVFNSALFLFARPIPSRHLPIEVYDAYCANFTRWSIKHQWHHNLGEIIRAHGAEIGAQGPSWQK